MIYTFPSYPTNVKFNSQIFNSSGSFTIPTGVYFLDIFMVGGGGTGGSGGGNNGYGNMGSGGGGGGGYGVFVQNF